LSIFTKDCPQCTTSNPLAAAYCRCGYCFEPDKVNGSAQALELEAQEEKLYLDYLKARISQTEESVRAARAVAAANPDSHAKAAEALLAEQALINARAELADQTARVRIATRRWESLRTVTRVPVTLRNKPATHAAKPVHHRKTSKPAPTLMIKDEAPPRPTPVIAATSSPVPQTVQPNDAFRAAHAARAEQVMKQLPPVVRDINPPPVPAPIVALPEKPLSAVVPSPAAPVLLVHSTPPVLLKTNPAHKDCPNCYAHVTTSLVRCRCGYEFSNGPQLPSLTLNAAERELFLSFGYSKPPKHGQ
jgi:hypothetical protein